MVLNAAKTHRAHLKYPLLTPRDAFLPKLGVPGMYSTIPLCLPSINLYFHKKPLENCTISFHRNSYHEMSFPNTNLYASSNTCCIFKNLNYEY